MKDGIKDRTKDGMQDGMQDRRWSDEPITLVTDQLPYPPRNGITLPLFNHLEQLRGTQPVSVCLLQGRGAAPAAADWDANERRYGAITAVALQRRPQATRALAELAGSEMFQHGWRAAGGPALDPAAFTRVLVSPMSAVAQWRALRRAQPALRPRLQVAAVNDCTTAEYRWRLRSVPGGAAARAKAWLDGWRAPLIGRIEAALLADYSRVLVQTEADRQAMHDLVGAATAARCLVVPNGVRPDLFQLQPRRGEQVLFVAELSGEYAAVTEWLCTQVWPAVLAAQPAARLLVVGGGASPRLRQRLAATAGVEHLDFAADLAPVYAGTGVVWSPVFKGFGLINKTLEAMASALPVVGGRAAFNGIAGFDEGVHGQGLTGADAAGFAAATVALLQSPQRQAQIGDAARELIRGQFSWTRSADALRQAFAPPPAGSL